MYSAIPPTAEEEPHGQSEKSQVWFDEIAATASEAVRRDQW